MEDRTVRLFRGSVRFDQMYLGVSTSLERDGLPDASKLGSLVPFSDQIWPPATSPATLRWPSHRQYSELEMRGILFGDPLAFEQLQAVGLVPPSDATGRQPHRQAPSSTVAR